MGLRRIETAWVTASILTYYVQQRPDNYGLSRHWDHRGDSHALHNAAFQTTRGVERRALPRCRKHRNQTSIPRFDDRVRNLTNVNWPMSGQLYRHLPAKVVCHPDPEADAINARAATDGAHIRGEIRHNHIRPKPMYQRLNHSWWG